MKIATTIGLGGLAGVLMVCLFIVLLCISGELDIVLANHADEIERIQEENVADREALRERLRVLEGVIDMSITGRAGWRLVDLNNQLVTCKNAPTVNLVEGE